MNPHPHPIEPECVTVHCTKHKVALLKESVDLEGLLDVLPTLGVLLLQKFNIPLPVILEAAGVDIDGIKTLVEAAKELINDV